MRHRAIGVLLATVLAMTVTLPAAAAKPSPPPDDAYYDPIVNAMEAMYQAGRSEAEVDAMLESDFGWIPAGSSGDEIVTLASENSDVEMRTPNVYYNTQQGRYEASAWFYWKDCGSQRCWKQDASLFTASVGGYDGFGIGLAKLVTRKTQYFSVYDENGSRTDYPNPWDADDSGATFRNQDKFNCPSNNCYNWDHGVIIYAFTIRAGCPKGNYSIKSKLAHTWSGSGVSSITVSTSGISVTFSGSNENWQAVNPTAKNWYPCGT